MKQGDLSSHPGKVALLPHLFDYIIRDGISPPGTPLLFPMACFPGGDIPTQKETLAFSPLAGEGNTRVSNITPGIPPRQLTDIPAGILRVSPNVTSGIPLLVPMTEYSAVTFRRGYFTPLPNQI